MTLHAARCLPDYYLALAIRQAAERGDRAEVVWLLSVWEDRGERMNGKRKGGS